MKSHAHTQLRKSDSGSRSVLSDSLRLHGLYSLWNSPGQNTGVGSLFLRQGIFSAQGWNPGLSLPAEPPGKPNSEQARWKRRRGQARAEGGASASSASAAAPRLQCAPEPSKHSRVFRRLHYRDLSDSITDYQRLNSASCPASLPGGGAWLEVPGLCHVIAHLGNQLPPH